MTSPLALTRFFIIAALSLAPACASSDAGGLAREAVLDPVSGLALRAPDLVGPSGYAALFFFSARCPCQRSHDARIAALSKRWKERGVATWAIASEADFDARSIERERAARGYDFPILLDPRGSFARAAAATFATHAVVIDRDGRIHHGGAIDSDAVTLHDEARRYLDDALAALLDGAAPKPGGEPKGCVLRKP